VKKTSKVFKEDLAKLYILASIVGRDNKKENETKQEESH